MDEVIYDSFAFHISPHVSACQPLADVTCQPTAKFHGRDSI